MSNQEYDIRDRSGKTNVRGTIHPAPGVANAIPQGGPLTQDLFTGGNALRGEDGTGTTGASITALAAPGVRGGNALVTAGDSPANRVGGDALLVGGNGNAGNTGGASINAQGGSSTVNNGRVQITTGGSQGVAGEALVSDGNAAVIFAGVQIAAAVPMGAPTGLPFAVDTTAVTGGLYVWNGAAWVKVSTIP